MNGLFIAAAITSVVAVLVWGLLIRQLAERQDRWLLVCLAIAALPLSYGTFHGVRMPFDQELQRLLGKAAPAYVAATLWYAPLTEEPAKLLPLLLLAVPPLRRSLTPRNAVPIAMALGLGFGIGEIWLVAELVLRKQPALAQLPFHQFGGLLSERLVVCLTHAGFTALPVVALRRSWAWLPFGLLGAMVLHFSGNFPVFLKGVNLWGLGAATWDVVLYAWLGLFLIGSLMLLAALHFGVGELRRIVMGKARCPGCGEVYSRPIVMGLNMGMKRYERCPACGKWHWIDARDNV